MTMDLFIETLTGVSFELHVSPAETIMSVKSKIQKAGGIPITQQHLIWRNDELDDHRRLRDYSISGGSTLRLVLGLHGGPLNAHRLPPIRLTPIQIAKSSFSSYVPKLEARSGRYSYFSRIFTGVNQGKSRVKASSTPSDLSKSDSSRSKSPDLMPTVQNSKNTTRVTQLQKPENKTIQNNDDIKRPTESVIPVATAVTCITTGRNLTECGTVTDLKSSEIERSGNSKKTGINGESNANEVHNATKSDTNNDDKTDRVQSDFSTEKKEFDAYPPLLPSLNLHRFSSLPNSREPPSYWRLCESRDLFAHLSRFTNDYQIEKIGKNGSDDALSKDNTDPLIETDHKKGIDFFDGVESSDIMDSITPASATATLLAGLLARPIPIQTSGTGRYVGHFRYPFHWLKRGPVIEDDGMKRPFLPPEFFYTDDIQEEFDTIVDNFLDADTEFDDDNEDEIVEEVGDAGDEKSALTYGLDDDDSLADLEEYLCYYGTGDLLFGPPSFAVGYPPYSYHTLKEPCGSNHWHSELGHEHSDGASHESLNSDLGQSGESAWHRECAQLSEKVKNLKAKMKVARSRRQVRQQNAKANIEEITEIAVDSSKDQVKLASKTAVSENSCTDENSKNSVNLVKQHRLSSSCSEVSSKGRSRQRRFGTVTPPDVNFLIQSCTNASNPILCQTGNLTVPIKSNDVPRTAASDSELTHLAVNDHSTVGQVLTNRSTLFHPKRPVTATTQAAFTPSKSVLPRTLPTINKGNSKLVVNSGSSVMKHPTASTDIKSSLDIGHSNMTLPQFLSNVRDSSIPGNISTTTTTTMSVSRLRLPTDNHSHGGDRSVTDESQAPNATSKLELEVGSVDGASHAASTLPIRLPTTPKRRKRCALCLRKIGLASSYTCRCGRNFCSRHRYAELHACQFDYKAEARRFLAESNPVVTAPKLPKI